MEQIAAALRKLAQAGVQEAALQLPARLSADAGVRALIGEPKGPARAIVFGPEPQKLVAALGQVARRASVPPPAAPEESSPPKAVASPSPAVPEERKPTPPPPQRYVPPPPKSHVFDKNRKK